MSSLEGEASLKAFQNLKKNKAFSQKSLKIKEMTIDQCKKEPWIDLQSNLTKDIKQKKQP
jgi:hypothetical protein